MARPVLIIDIGNSSLRAGVCQGGDLERMDIFTSPLGEGLKAALLSLLDEIRSKGIKIPSTSVAGLPLAAVSMRVINLPFSDKKKLDEVIAFEAGDIFLKSVEDLVIGTLPLSDGRVLVASIEKGVLKGYLDILKEFDIDPVWAGVSLFSKASLLRRLYDGQDEAALLDSDSLVVIKGQQPRFFKEIRSAQDLRLALSALSEDGVNVRRFYAEQGSMDALSPLGIEAVPVKEFQGGAGVCALASGFMDGFKEAINFRRGEFADTKEIESAKKGLKVTAALIATLCIFWGAYSYLKYKALKASLVQGTSKMEQDYRGIFQGEQRVVDALSQLEVKLKNIKEEKRVMKAGVDVLEAMRGLSEAAGDTVRLYRLQMQPGRITASGESASFEAANNFRDSLSRLPYFKDITLTDLKARPSAGVSFSITASTKDVS